MNLFNSSKENQEYDIDIALKKGTYLTEPFDQMNLAILLKSGVMHIDDISMTRDTSMGFHIVGLSLSNSPNDVGSNCCPSIKTTSAM